ncbi:YheU family protein [Thalassotalea sp. PLHSN55]|uniref:YheU family protein n=1 Tax=Thalassotalea sp. PLHSN55 TaxID=3435888 RepID=UPI003F831C6E
MIIPVESLTSEVLEAIIKEFVLREGTDYGCEDIEMIEKIADVKAQLKQGSAILVYSELYETVNIIPADQYQQE